MTTLSQTQAQTLLDELAQRVGIAPIDEACEITAAMLAERTGQKAQWAGRHLRQLADAGELTARQALCNGKIVIAYRKAQ